MDASLTKNIEYYNRSMYTIAHGALTNSKRAESYIKGVYPTHIQGGLNCYVWDVDGKRYIDYICSLGANLFGHNNKHIKDRVKKQLDLGTIYSMGSSLEVEVAEKFKSMFPFINRLRFLKTGTEACMASIRIARAYNKKQIILSNGYHGWSSEFVSLTPPANGVYGNFLTANLPPFEELENNKKLLDNTSCIIVEPVVTDYSEDRKKYLLKLKEICIKNNIVLIFDETITGYRFPKYCVANYYGIEPDLIVLGKGIGGGFPLSIVGGRSDIMESDYFVSSTFAGDCVALSAADAAIDLITGDMQPERLWEYGSEFISEFNSIDSNIIKIDGYPARGIIVGSDINKALFMQQACKSGLLFGPSWFYTITHHEEKNNVISICKIIIDQIKKGAVVLEGEMPKKPFAQKQRERS